ncbi:hypothetical protein JCM8547_001956 [Rhodosporidiobolus lusitaniae]
MGLASKLAQAQANPDAYSAAPAAAPVKELTRDVPAILRILEEGVHDQNLSHFYPPGSLQPVAQRIAQTGALSQIAQMWRLPLEIAMDLARLALFDTVIHCDDSGSMSFEENGSRIEELKSIVGKIATAAGLFDADGIQIRWMNSKKEGNNFTNEQQAYDLISKIKFNRGTPLGISLHEKVLEPLVLKPIKKGKLKKPLLIICVTDGAPTGEARDTIIKVMKETKKTLDKTPFTSDAVSFQLAQVGNDMEAREFLEWIDEDKTIGSLVDTTSGFEHEQDNFSKANPPVHLTREMWLAKLLLGPIHSGWDAADEK